MKGSYNSWTDTENRDVLPIILRATKFILPNKKLSENRHAVKETSLQLFGRNIKRKSKPSQSKKLEAAEKVQIKEQLKTVHNISPVKLESVLFRQPGHKDSFFKFYIGKGNNRQLVLRMMEKRRRWIEVDSPFVSLNFRWQQTNRTMRYDRLEKGRNSIKKVFNHMEHHNELTTKDGLFRNLKRYCQLQSLKLFERIPVTFVLNLTDELADQELNSFVKFFLKNYSTKKLNKEQRRVKAVEFKRSIGRNPVPYEGQRKIKLSQNIRPITSPIYFTNDSYLWLLKPVDQNRGRGIHIFSSLEELSALLNQLQKDLLKRSDLMYKSERKYILQKYMERPLLYENRKFDIRLWVLIDHMQNVYFFPEGYVRTSCQKYSLESKNNYVHLTNNAVQKNSPNYGSFQLGNQIPLDQLQTYFSREVFSKEQFLGTAKRLIVESIMATGHLLNKQNRQFTFQLLGYDFMIGSDGTVWLIQVNTNPCIQQSSPLLCELLPAMIDGALRLTIDNVFWGESHESQPGPKWQFLCPLKMSKVTG